MKNNHCTSGPIIFAELISRSTTLTNVTIEVNAFDNSLGGAITVNPITTLESEMPVLTD